MDIREQITINGNIAVKLQPYTELRHEKLMEVEKEIDEFAEENPTLTVQDMDKKKRAYFWKRKAEIVWEPNPVMGENGTPLNMPESHWDKKAEFFTLEFFMDKSFEAPLLKKSVDFFLIQDGYL